MVGTFLAIAELQGSWLFFVVNFCLLPIRVKSQWVYIAVMTPNHKLLMCGTTTKACMSWKSWQNLKCSVGYSCIECDTKYWMKLLLLSSSYLLSRFQILQLQWLFLPQNIKMNQEKPAFFHTVQIFHWIKCQRGTDSLQRWEHRSPVPFKSTWKAVCPTCCFIPCPLVPWVFVSKARGQPPLPARICPRDARWAPRALGQLPWLVSSCCLVSCIHNPCPFGLAEICEDSLIHLSEKLGSLAWGVSSVPWTEQADMRRQRNSSRKLAESRDSSFQQQRDNQGKRCLSPKSFQFLAN